MTDSANLVQVKDVSNEPEARIILGFLQAQGINAIIHQDDAGDQLPSLEDSQGVQIFVPAEDAETARALLAEREAADVNDSGEEEE